MATTSFQTTSGAGKPQAQPRRDDAVAEALEQVHALAELAKVGQRRLARSTGRERDDLLRSIADSLVAHAADIEAANALDLKQARMEGMSEGLLDRLTFTKDRIAATAQGVRDVANQPDPLGRVVRGSTLPNGMRLTQTRVPMGVVGMIYEARPNVTVDVAALCLKSGNAAILRGGHAAERTNAATLHVIGNALETHGFAHSLVQSVDHLGRAGATAMMEARGSIDVLVPRGGKGLIQAVVANSKVPVIETGAGNCHIYVDKAADLGKALPILINAKTQRVGVCNAAEKLIVHKGVAAAWLPVAAAALAGHGVQIRADERAYAIIDAARANAQDGNASAGDARDASASAGSALAGLDLRRATEEDWDTEYLDYIIGVKVVDSLDEAVAHINAHSTGHTEAIVSEDYSAVEAFVAGIESAVVMVNASTRFTDGGMFGLGAELGISTQKLHARGPMGLEELTTTQWVGYGTGQVRQ